MKKIDSANAANKPSEAAQTEAVFERPHRRDRVAELTTEIISRSAWWFGAMILYAGYEWSSTRLILLSVAWWIFFTYLAWKLSQRQDKRQ